MLLPYLKKATFSWYLGTRNYSVTVIF